MRPLSLQYGRVGMRNSIIQELTIYASHPERKKSWMIEPIVHLLWKILQNKSAAHARQKSEASVKVCWGHGTDGCGNFRFKMQYWLHGLEGVLASSIRNDYVDRSNLAFGIESEVDYTDDSLHFFVDPDKLRRCAWDLSDQDENHALVWASYREKPKSCATSGLLEHLAWNFRNHGGYISFGLREPVLDNFHGRGIPLVMRLPRPAKNTPR